MNSESGTTPQPVRRVAVLGGGGLMGHGIALACLTGSECEVVLISRREESVTQGLSWVRSGQYGLDRAVARGKLTPDAAEAAKRRVSG
ncbi:MAG: 3-hydroxyacyl-CoA dehydrogenase NAD-binding domain-containing protein, partial [Acidimicrobiia bacterium]